MDGERLLDGLNEAQLAAVTTPASDDGPIIVLAGAGSGKTRVLTRRIAWRVVRGEADPKRILTLTFTRKAAEELRERQRQLGLRDHIPAGTFHGIALTQLRQRWTEKRQVPPTLLNGKVRFVSQLAPRKPGVEVIDLVAEMDWARARLLGPENYGAAAEAAGRKPPIPAAELGELMERYRQEKRRRRVVDFDDLLTLAIRDLRSDPDYAAAVRWRHRHFFVDEFQDVNPLQHALLNEWLGNRTDLFIVGDPNQAIYAWNGADPTLLDRMADDPAATVIELNDNYRSTPQILTLAGTALRRPTSDGGPGRSKRGSLRAHLPDGPRPTLTSYGTDRAEADGIADMIRESNVFPARWSDQAVLVRTNAQLVLIEQALNDAHIPCQVRSGPGPLGSAEVKTELKAIGRDGIDLFKQLEELDDRLRKPPEQQTRMALERHSNLSALSRVIHEYLTVDPLPTGPGLMAWIDTLQKGDVDSEADAVDLVTFHGAKGLEWPIVHLAGLEDGFVPIAYAKTEDQQAEEERLLYVALTRAQQQLHLTWAKERTFGTNTVKRGASPLLEQLRNAILSVAASDGRSANWRAHIAESRRSIPIPDGPADDEPDLLEALRTWRARKAKAGLVPPHVIVPDQVLKVIADTRPTAKGQLAAVPGMRPLKLQRYGDEILDVLRSASGASAQP